MNKFKKIMLGALSALTLGLFVAVGTKVEAASTQPYVYADFSGISQDKDGNDITSTFSNTKTVAVNGFDIVLAGGGGTIQSAQTNGLKMNKASNTISFTTLDVAKITILLYIDKSDGSKEMAVSNNDGTNPISITGLKQNSSIAETTLNGNYKYSVTNSNSGKDISINVLSSPTATYTISNCKDKTVYLKSIKIQPYATVSYELNGGTAISDKTALYGDKYTPETPADRDGYSFVGWYTNEGLTDAYDADSIVSDDFTLYAKWLDNSSVVYHSVTFKNGTTTVATVNNIIDGNSVGSEDWPTAPRYLSKTFDGWYNGSTKYESSTPITEDDLVLTTKYSDLANDLVEFGDYYSALPTDNANPHIGSFDITTDSKVQVQEINKRKTGTVTFDDNTQLSGCVQCQKVVFTLDEAALVSIYAIQTGSGKNRTSKLFKGENEVASFVFGYSDKTTITYYLEAGTYTVSIFENSDGSGTLADYYGIRVNNNYLAADTSASVFAEKNTAGDTLRFVGTLTGITDLANIDSIELILEKDGVATKKQIFLTTCYISVTGASQTCAEADNTYYVVYRITGISGLTGTISKQLKVTFTDGSYTLSAATEFDL